MLPQLGFCPLDNLLPIATRTSSVALGVPCHANALRQALTEVPARYVRWQLCNQLLIVRVAFDNTMNAFPARCIGTLQRKRNGSHVANRRAPSCVLDPHYRCRKCVVEFSDMNQTRCASRQVYREALEVGERAIAQSSLVSSAQDHARRVGARHSSPSLSETKASIAICTAVRSGDRVSRVARPSPTPRFGVVEPAP